MLGTVGRAIATRNLQWLQGWVAGRYGVALDVKIVSELLEIAYAIAVGGEMQTGPIDELTGERCRTWAFSHWKGSIAVFVCTKDTQRFDKEGRPREISVGELWFREPRPEDDWFMWFGNRLRELNVWPIAGCKPPLDIDLPVELHMGFLSVEETAEHLARLNNEHLRPKPDKPPRRRPPVKLIGPMQHIENRVPIE